MKSKKKKSTAEVGGEAMDVNKLDAGEDEPNLFEPSPNNQYNHHLITMFNTYYTGKQTKIEKLREYTGAPCSS